MKHMRPILYIRLIYTDAHPHGHKDQYWESFSTARRFPRIDNSRNITPDPELPLKPLSLLKRTHIKQSPIRHTTRDNFKSVLEIYIEVLGNPHKVHTHYIRMPN